MLTTNEKPEGFLCRFMKVTFSYAQCKTSVFSCVREEFYEKRGVSGKYLPKTWRITGREVVLHCE